jgi:hypothetical protein
MRCCQGSIVELNLHVDDVRNAGSCHGGHILWVPNAAAQSQPRRNPSHIHAEVPLLRNSQRRSCFAERRTRELRLQRALAKLASASSGPFFILREGPHLSGIGETTQAAA